MPFNICIAQQPQVWGGGGGHVGAGPRQEAPFLCAGGLFLPEWGPLGIENGVAAGVDTTLGPCWGLDLAHGARDRRTIKAMTPRAVPMMNAGLHCVGGGHGRQTANASVTKPPLVGGGGKCSGRF